MVPESAFWQYKLTIGGRLGKRIDWATLAESGRVLLSKAGATPVKSIGALAQNGFSAPERDLLEVWKAAHWGDKTSINALSTTFNRLSPQTELKGAALTIRLTIENNGGKVPFEVVSDAEMARHHWQAVENAVVGRVRMRLAGVAGKWEGFSLRREMRKVFGPFGKGGDPWQMEVNEMAGVFEQ